MPKYNVEWTKVYYVTGTEVVEADDEFAAEEDVRSRLGDLEGSKQYHPEQNSVEAWEKSE